MPREFPEINPGGSLIVAWQVKSKNVLVVGGGEVSEPSDVHLSIYYINAYIQQHQKKKKKGLLTDQPLR